MAAFATSISSTPLQDLVNTQCPICKDSLYFQNSQPVEINTCNHKFHKKCLNDWCGRNNNQSSTCNCPYCRNEFNYKTELKKIGTQIRNKVRAATNLEINDINYSDVYDEEDAVQEIKDKIKHMKRDGTRRKAGQQTTTRNRRSPNRSLSASSLTPSPARNNRYVELSGYNGYLYNNLSRYSYELPTKLSRFRKRLFRDGYTEENSSLDESKHIRPEDIQEIVRNPKQWTETIMTNLLNNHPYTSLELKQISNALFLISRVAIVRYDER